MKKRILNNWGLKLISLGIAISLWFLAMQMDDPQDKSTFSDVSVKILNTKILEDRNMAYEVLDGTDEVRVTVRAPKSIINKLREDDIVATADLSKMTADNMVPISYDVQNVGTNKNEIRVEGNVEMLKLSVEEKRTVWVPIKYEIQGEVADEYMISTVTTDQTSMEISGAKSIVEKIDYAKVELGVNGATTDVSSTVNVKLIDREGNVIDAPAISEKLNRVHIEVEVLLTKEVPVEAESMGVPGEGYLPTGVIEADVPQVKIAGKAGVLNNITKILVPAEEFDITDRTANLVKTVGIKDYLPNNVRFADSKFNGKVTFTVYVEPSVEETVEISDENIEVINLPQDFAYRIAEHSKPYSVKVSGLKADIEELKAEDVKAEVDVTAWMTKQGLSALRVGRYSMPAELVLEEGLTSEEKLSVSIVIYKKENKGE